MKPAPDPWQHILVDLEPNILNLERAMEYGPTIKPKLYKFGKHTWAIRLEEIWPDLIQWQGGSSGLDTAVEWCEKTLETWKNCKRQSWDTWSFDSKKNAEQFITFYILACKN